MRDFRTLINQAHAKRVLEDGRRLWKVVLPDRVVYIYYSNDGNLDGFTLRKSDALNKKLKELIA